MEMLDAFEDEAGGGILDYMCSCEYRCEGKTKAIGLSKRKKTEIGVNVGNGRGF